MRRATKSALWTAAGVGGAAAGGAALLGGAAAVAGAVWLARVLLARKLPEGAVVVVTGGSRGLGLEIASQFARRPVRLVLAARGREELEHAQRTLLERHRHLKPEDFYLVQADLSDRSACERVVEEAIASFARIDVLVNNAGIIQVGPYEAQPIEAYEYALKIMYQAPLYLTLAAVARMREQEPLAGWSRRGAVINIASIGGKLAVPHLLPYSAAKFALVGFSEGLHAELAHKGVHVMTVCPGLMRTGGENHATFVGDQQRERAWFQFSATTLGLSATVQHAARKIVASLEQGRAEITITPQAWLAARMAGLCPETTQWLAAQANHYIPPPPPRQEAPESEPFTAAAQHLY